MPHPPLIACHECDLLHRLGPLPPGSAARCRRCDALLVYARSNSLERTLALACAGLVLILLANAFPFLDFEIQGRVQRTLLVSGILELHRQEMTVLALLVSFTTIVAPLAHLLGLLYVLLPLVAGFRLPGVFRVFRLMRRFQPWSMMEVFMLGVLVTIVKLAKMAQIVPGAAVYCFMALILVLAACTATLDPHAVWERWQASAP